MESYTGATDTADFARRVEDNQRRLKANLKGAYDYIVCGSGTSGSVVARRLAENPDVSVLLLEAGGTDDVPSVTDASIWFTNLGSERDWQFQAQPNPHLNNRAIPLSMGKVLGGGSSINVMVWARGHSSDWDHFASESGDPAWNYQSTLATYRRIENWQGRQTHCAEARAVWSSCNLRLIPIRLRRPCWARWRSSGCLFSMTRTAR